MNLRHVWRCWRKLSLALVVFYSFCQFLKLCKVRISDDHALGCMSVQIPVQRGARLPLLLQNIWWACRTLAELLHLHSQKSDCLLRKLWLHASHVEIQILLVKRILDSSAIVNEGNFKLTLIFSHWAVELCLTEKVLAPPFRRQRTRAILGCSLKLKRSQSFSGQQIPISSLWLKTFPRHH